MESIVVKEINNMKESNERMAKETKEWNDKLNAKLDQFMTSELSILKSIMNKKP